MPQPTGTEVHVSRPLTDISVAYMQAPGDFVADKIFPIVQVAKEANQYYIYDAGDWHRSEAKKRGRSSESAGGGWNLSTDNYFCDTWAIHKDVDDRDRANASAPLDMDRDATLWVTEQLLLAREIEFAANFLATSVWSADVTPGTLWDASGGDPVGDVKARATIIKKATGRRPNTLVCTPDTWDAITDQATVLDRIKYTQTGIVTKQLVAAAMEIERVLVASAIKNTANEDATPVNAFISGTKSALLAYSAPNPGIMQPSAGYTFAWTGLMGASAYGNRITKMRMPTLTSDRVEGELAFDQKLVASSLGVFFDAVIS